MRKSKQTADEIHQMEKAQDDRKQSRARGYELMPVRDRGNALVRDHNGREVIFLWHVPPEKRREHVSYSGVPDGYFGLEIDNKLSVFDGEEFRKWLRWV